MRRTITTPTARRIASEWYSPRQHALVALATWTHPLTDTLALELVHEVELELDTAREQLARGEVGRTEGDVRDLHRLLNWARAEARHRGLIRHSA